MIGTAFRKKVPAMRLSSRIKKINHSKIYHMIYRESKGVSKQEIMRRLGLSLPTVTQKLEELRLQGKNKTVQFKELMARKLVNQQLRLRLEQYRLP